MKLFAAALAVAFGIPLLLSLAACARLFWFWRTSSPATGAVSSVTGRDWINEEAEPAPRYFASVKYFVAQKEYVVSNWGPHVASPILGSPVAVRYANINPANARVWQPFVEKHWAWLLVPVLLCALVEVWALHVWLKLA